MQQLILEIGLSPHFQTRRALVCRCTWVPLEAMRGDGHTRVECALIRSSGVELLPEAAVPEGSGVVVFTAAAPEGLSRVEAVGEALRLIRFGTKNLDTPLSGIRALALGVHKATPWHINPLLAEELCVPTPWASKLLNELYPRLPDPLNPEMQTLRREAQCYWDTAFAQFQTDIEQAPGLALLECGDLVEACVRARLDLHDWCDMGSPHPDLHKALEQLLSHMEDLLPAMAQDLSLAQQAWLAMLPARLLRLSRSAYDSQLLNAIADLHHFEKDAQQLILRIFGPLHGNLRDEESAAAGLAMHLNIDLVRQARADPFYFDTNLPF